MKGMSQNSNKKFRGNPTELRSIFVHVSLCVSGTIMSRQKDPPEVHAHVHVSSKVATSHRPKLGWVGCCAGWAKGVGEISMIQIEEVSKISGFNSKIVLHLQLCQKL